MIMGGWKETSILLIAYILEGEGLMANITKQKRDQMIAFLEKLKKEHSDDASVRAFNEIENHIKDKKFGLVFEEHTEEVDELLKENIPVLCEDRQRRICKKIENPWNFLIEGDNLQALYLLEKTHRGKISCIYIDPPYNTGAKDWKYNNNYVVKEDVYRHSKWLSMMKVRLLMAKKLLNPNDSVLICTIDEKEYLHLGCLLEELFPEAKIQMITDVINPRGTNRANEFSRVDEYVYICRIGKASVVKTEDNMLGNTDESRKGRVWDSYNRTNNLRYNHNNQFYPIYIDEEKKQIIKVGEPLDVNCGQDEFPKYEGLTAVFPVRKNGEESSWRAVSKTTREWIEKGYVRVVGQEKSGRWLLNYIPSGLQKRIEEGEIVVGGKTEDGVLDLKRIDSVPKVVNPKTVWNLKRHNATDYGINLLNQILDARSFSYPKSLYSVFDAISFFVKDKPEAIVLDFFAGSGTTQHAVNLLNKTDGGNRKCIMVTNNECSAKEEKQLVKAGYKKGDAEWEAYGIAHMVTWPRTRGSIEGIDFQGKKLKGEYLVNGIDGKPIKMSEGFDCNIKYLKCDWTPRKPKDYLLSNALCLHIKEMIELQNALEIDGKENVLILNKDDINKYIMDDSKYSSIRRIWLNQNIILNAEELELLRNKGFKYIPREFFGQELREAAE